MKLAGIVSIANQNTWRMCVPKLRGQVDYLSIRIQGDCDIIEKEVMSLCEPDNLFVSFTEWNAWNWREELLRSLDRVKPDIVLHPDDDEEFGDGIKDELKLFWQSNKLSLWCDKYLMKTVDNRQTPTYPTAPHMQGYKWQVGLSYTNYSGYAQVDQYAWNEQNKWHMKTPYYHYAFWTKEMEIEKTKYAINRFGML